MRIESFAFRFFVGHKHNESILIDMELAFDWVELNPNGIQYWWWVAWRRRIEKLYNSSLLTYTRTNDENIYLFHCYRLHFKSFAILPVWLICAVWKSECHFRSCDFCCIIRHRTLHSIWGRALVYCIYTIYIYRNEHHRLCWYFTAHLPLSIAIA